MQRFSPNGGVGFGLWGGPSTVSNGSCVTNYVLLLPSGTQVMASVPGIAARPVLL